MDPMTVSAIIGGGTSLLGGLMGGKDAKKASQRAFEQSLYFAKNAHQLEVADLRAAGLNPILSSGGKGAAAGPGYQYQTNLHAGTEAANSAISAMTARAQLDNIKAQTVHQLASADQASSAAAATRQNIGIKTPAQSIAEVASSVVKPMSHSAQKNVQDLRDIKGTINRSRNLDYKSDWFWNKPPFKKGN